MRQLYEFLKLRNEDEKSLVLFEKGALQTTCMIIGCALMTHGFVTGRPHLKYELGQSLWLAWGGTQFGILLTAVLCTAGCDCWKKCEIKPKKKKGKKEEGKDKESKRKDVEKSSHGNQFGKSSKSAESGKSNKNSQSEKSSKQAENEKITQEGQNTAKISESPHYVTSREIYHQQSGSDLQLKDSLKKEPQETVTKMDKTAKNGQAGKGNLFCVELQWECLIIYNVKTHLLNDAKFTRFKTCLRNRRAYTHIHVSVAI